MTELYWITTLGRISGTITLICIGLAVILLVIGIALAVCWEDLPAETCKKWFYRCGGFLLLLLVIDCFIPSTNELYAIYGIGTVIDYAQGSDEVQKLPDNAIKAINAYLEGITDNNLKEKSGKEK